MTIKPFRQHYALFRRHKKPLHHKHLQIYVNTSKTNNGRACAATRTIVLYDSMYIFHIVSALPTLRTQEARKKKCVQLLNF